MHGFIRIIFLFFIFSGIVPGLFSEISGAFVTVNADEILKPQLLGNTTGDSAPEAVLNFSASPTEGFPPLCVKFTLNGPDGDYSWDFGDGTTSTVKNPVHCYKEEGLFWVKLKYYYGSTVREVVKQNYISVKSPELNISFTANPTSGSAPLTTQFSATGNPTNIIWHFGDGTDDSSDLNPQHQYVLPGEYTPTLTYCASGECDKIYKVNYISVGDGRSVNFSADHETGMAPICTRFSVLGDADDFRWDFGDGEISYERDPVHCYKNAGTYTVELTYSIDGAYYTITRAKYLTYLSKEVSDFNVTPLEGIAPLCVSYTIINPSQSWEFQFGDNSTSKSAQVTHCYKSGIYYPSLISCSNGLCNTVNKSVPVEVRKPKIDVSAGKTPNQFTFRTDAPSGMRYTWDFGDGSGADGAAVNHTYMSAGTFPVSLVINGNCGCNEVIKTKVEIEPDEKLSFTATPISGCAPHCVQFNEQSVREPVSRLWEFGDGETGEEKNPFHCYRFSGKYSVTLTDKYSDHVEQEKKQDLIIVYGVPEPAFSVYPPQGYAPLTVKVSDTTYDDYVKRFWDFGDGTTGTDISTEHRYNEPGDYNITLTVWGEGGCWSNNLKTVHVTKKESPAFNFSGLPRRGAVPVCISYQISRQIKNPQFEFGDGQTTSELNPFHCYESAGIYTPKLHACNDSSGCMDIIKPGYIVALDPSYLNISLMPGWNLVSVPVTLDDGKDTMEILSEVNTGGHSVFSWNSTKGGWYKVSLTDHVDPLSAFWIYSVDPLLVPLSIAQESPEQNLTRMLSPGWNLVGFADVEPISADEAFASVEKSWNYLLGYDAENHRNSALVKKGVNSAVTTVDPGDGYWIFMNSSARMIGMAL